MFFLEADWGFAGSNRLQNQGRLCSKETPEDAISRRPFCFGVAAKKSGRRTAQARAQFRGDTAVTNQAQGPHVIEVAFAAAFSDWNNMVGVPQRSPLSRSQPPSCPGFHAAGTGEPLEAADFRFAIDPAERTCGAIAGHDLFAKITGITAKFPFADAPFRAEGEPAGRHLEIAPPAQGTAVLASEHRLPVHIAARHGASRLHQNILT